MTRKDLKIKLIFLFPIFLLVANIASKIIYLTSQSIQLDEPFSIYHAQFEVPVIIDQLKNYNNPPLFEIILHFWMNLFGISPLSVRTLPMVFASLCPIALFYFSKQYFSVRVAVCSSLLLSCSSLLMFYAQDCRVYSLFLLLTILSMNYFLKTLKHTTSKFSIAFFIIASVMLVYAHYFGIYVLFLQMIFLFSRHKNRLLEFMLYYLVIFIFYLPHMYILFTRMTDSVDKGTWLQPPEGLESLYNMLWSFSNAPLVTVICLAFLLSALINGYLKKKHLKASDTFSLILYWFLFSFFGLFFISFWVPVYLSRYLIFVLPSYFVLLAFCADNLFSQVKMKYFALIFLVFCFGASVNLKPDKKHDPAPALKLLSFLKDPETIVIAFPKDFSPTFAYHYNKFYFSAVSSHSEYGLTDSLLRAEHNFLLNTLEELDQVKIGKYKKIICLTSGTESATLKLIDQLKTQYRSVGAIYCKDNFHLNFCRVQ